MTSILRRLTLPFLLAWFSASGSVGATPGQPGTLDATWAASSPLGFGKVMTSVGSAADDAYAVVVQPDGKVLLVGTCATGGPTGDDFCALRYSAAGAIDTSFGTGGRVIVAVSANAGADKASAAVLQTDGKILIAGTCAGEFCAIRLNANGAPDTSFGTAGKVSTPVEGGDTAKALVLQSDGKLVIAGYCSFGYTFCAVRYNANGTFDNSFSGDGKTSVPVPGGIELGAANAALLQADGKLVIAGNCNSEGQKLFCATRINGNGTLDTTWGGGLGWTYVSITNDTDQAFAVGAQSSGKLVISGHCRIGQMGQLLRACATRLDTNGSLDTSFGNAGKAIDTVGEANMNVSAVGIQADDKIIIAGTCTYGGIRVFCAIRYNAHGTPDGSFPTVGALFTSIGSESSTAYSIAIQPNGKFLLAGACRNTGGNNDFCAARYDGGPYSCQPDLDGDNAFLATTDALIYMRVALGITGTAVVNGINFPGNATRNTWPLIRNYLVTQCGLSLPQ